MKIQQAGRSGIAMLLERKELEDRGVSWEQFSGVHARQWVIDALRMLGAPATAPVAIEAFKHDDGILVLARLSAAVTCVYFDDFETLLTAVHYAKSPPGPCDLYAADGGYILAFTGDAPPVWYEFGRQWDGGTAARLNEYAKPLLRGDAAVRLAGMFTRL